MKVGDLVRWKVFDDAWAEKQVFEYGVVTETKDSSYHLGKFEKKKKIVTVFTDGVVTKFFCHELEIVDNKNELPSHLC